MILCNYKVFFIFLLTYSVNACIAFSQELDPELGAKINALKSLPEDTNKLNLLNTIILEAPDGVWEKYNHQLKELSFKLMQSKISEIKLNATKAHASALNNEAFILDSQGKFESALPLYQQSLSLSKKIDDQQGVGESLNNIADLYQSQGNIELAIQFFRQSLAVRELIKDQEGIAESLNNLGFLYDKLGDFTKALDYHQRSLKIRERINDLDGVSGSLINIGNIYVNNLDEAEKSIEYYRKSIHIQLVQGDKKLEAYAIDNIGVAQRKIAEKIIQKNGFNGLVAQRLDSSLFYFSKSLNIRKAIEDKKGMANSLNNIGEVYQTMGKLNVAEPYLSEALLIRKELNNKKDIAFSLTNLANLYYRLNKLAEAKKYADEALIYAKELGFPENIKRISKLLNELYFAKGDYKQSLEMYKLYILMRDSIQNQEAKKEMFKQQFQFEYDKKAEADSLIAAEEKKVVDAKFKQERTQRWALYGGLIAVLIFSALMYNRFRITQKQKNIIELKELETQKQKFLVEKKNTEILSSIEYAKRIQATILPPLKDFKKHLPDSFVLYLPKDIVAGDFYWLKTKGESPDSDNGLILLASCDSTGHGVPGALVSVVCSKALDKAVNEFGLTQPSLILDKVAELVIDDFSKNNDENDEIKDGMDVSLCSINFENNEINWAGANNPLWLITSTGDFIEFKPDKQPIGKSDNRFLFTHHSYRFNKGDLIYLITDGYADQFGGAKGKKFQRAKLKELLVSNAKEPMRKQHEVILNAFINWKGAEDQVDDVCVIGVRV